MAKRQAKITAPWFPYAAVEDLMKRKYPILAMPYLPPEWIMQHPMLSLLSTAWSQAFQTASQLEPDITGKMSAALWRAQELAFTPTSPTEAMRELSQMMRPAFEAEAARQLEFAREQLARTLGTPTGGAIAETLRRQLVDLEKQWLRTLGEIGMQELQQRRQMQLAGLRMVPQIASATAFMPFMPYLTAMQGLTPFAGTFIGPGYSSPSPHKPTFWEQLAPLVFLSIFGGGIQFS